MVSTAAYHAIVRGSFPGLCGLKETKLFLPHPLGQLSIVGWLRDREVACLTPDRQGSNLESCVWRTVSSHSSHHPREVLVAQFNFIFIIPSYWERNVCSNINISKCLFSNEIKTSNVFTHLKLWFAVARHNFKWVNILRRYKGLRTFCRLYRHSEIR